MRGGNAPAKESSVYKESKGVIYIKNADLREIDCPPSPSVENASVHQGQSKKPFFVLYMDPNAAYGRRLFNRNRRIVSSRTVLASAECE